MNLENAMEPRMNTDETRMNNHVLSRDCHRVNDKTRGVHGFIGFNPWFIRVHPWPTKVFQMNRHAHNGFTLIELLVVMAIIAMLLTIAVPRYFHSVEKSREAVLHQNLALTREALDKFYSDNNRYPDSLDDLVGRKYLRSLPVDPFTGNATSWLVVPPETADKGGVFDIHSGAPGNARDGSAYGSW